MYVLLAQMATLEIYYCNNQCVGSMTSTELSQILCNTNTALTAENLCNKEVLLLQATIVNMETVSMMTNSTMLQMKFTVSHLMAPFLSKIPTVNRTENTPMNRQLVIAVTGYNLEYQKGVPMHVGVHKNITELTRQQICKKRCLLLIISLN